MTKKAIQIVPALLLYFLCLEPVQASNILNGYNLDPMNSASLLENQSNTDTTLIPRFSSPSSDSLLNLNDSRLDAAAAKMTLEELDKKIAEVECKKKEALQELKKYKDFSHAHAMSGPWP